MGRSTQTDRQMSQAGLMLLLFRAEAQRLLTDAKQKHGGGADAGRVERERGKAEARWERGEEGGRKETRLSRCESAA